MANIYFIGGPLEGTYRTGLTQHLEYHFWDSTRNGVALFVHGTSSEWISVTQEGFFEQLPYVVKKVAQELIDKGGHPDTLDIHIEPEVIANGYGGATLMYTVSGTALEVS